MKFASHVEEIDISGIRKSFEGAGPGAINLGIGQPDFDTPDHIKRAAIEAIEEGFTGYTMNMGTAELRAALSEKLKRENRIDYSPREIMVTSGASEALFLAIAAVVEEGDEVLMGDPGFVSYSALARIARGRPVGVPLDERFHLTADAVAERITPKTRALVVNSPNNPTGSVQTAEELRCLAELADDHDFALISDEVYEQFIYEGEHVSPALYSDDVITINAVSKTYAMTGWRLGYVAARGEAIENMLKVHQYVQACASSISQMAALAAVSGTQEPVRIMREEFKRRRDVLVSGLRSMGVDIKEPEGAFYAFPEVGDGDDVAARLIRGGVVTVPGSAFGPRGRGHIRISYAASMEDLKTALERMRDIL
ncbi:MAG: putative aspartate aminotransferase [Methanothrix sp.]|jgi:aspartate aminotransferase|nr:MAG: putative aspartate aminotransferase [Methanothrix sp.]